MPSSDKQRRRPHQARGEPAPADARRHRHGNGDGEHQAGALEVVAQAAHQVEHEEAGEQRLQADEAEHREAHRPQRRLAQHRGDVGADVGRRQRRARHAVDVEARAQGLQRHGRQRRQGRDHQQRRAPACFGRQHRRHHARDHQARRHAGLLEREDQRRQTRRRQAAEQMRARRRRERLPQPADEGAQRRTAAASPRPAAPARRPAPACRPGSCAWRHSGRSTRRSPSSSGSPRRRRWRHRHRPTPDRCRDRRRWRRRSAAPSSDPASRRSAAPSSRRARGRDWRWRRSSVGVRSCPCPVGTARDVPSARTMTFCLSNRSFDLMAACPTLPTTTWRSVVQGEAYDFIVTGAGSAGCAVAGRLTRGRPLSRAAARGRAQGQLSLDPHPARLPQDLQQSARQLDVRQRAGARAQQPHHVPAARQGAGRHQLDQRHGLHARQRGRLRRVAPARLRGLGLRFGAALLQARRGPGARRRRIPRRRRAAESLRPSLAADAGQGHARGRPAGRHPGQSRLQRRDPGRRRLLPDHHQPGAALVERAGLSARGARSARTSPSPPRRTPPAC